jgi:acyl-CoA reductase-like NAD-dependent aldehyde dehydrogenase
VLAVAKISAALVMGNCVIVKPSPFTPYSILRLAELAVGIFPPGVFQAINGDNRLGPLFVSHAGLDKIGFTGSTATGKRIMEMASKTLKAITLELGGNNAAIICADVDIAKVAPQVAMAAFYHSGQVCIASKRIYVHKHIYEPFLEALTVLVKSWKVGPVSDEQVMLGPVQNKQQYDLVQDIFKDSKENSYNFATGDRDEMTSTGYMIQPAIVDNPPDSSRIVQEEPFGDFPLTTQA